MFARLWRIVGEGQGRLAQVVVAEIEAIGNALTAGYGLGEDRPVARDKVVIVVEQLI